MTSINPNQINSMAQEIAKLLDAKEETAETRGNDTIEASIWNKFVGQGQPQEQQVGNGDKSTIKNHISMSDAVNSIASYIKNKGTTAISNALKQLGIDWQPSEEVKPNTSNSTSKSDAKDPDSISEQIKNVKNSDKYKEAKAKMEKEQKKYVELDKLKSTAKASNGMTYNQIMGELRQIVNRNWGGVVKDEKTGKPRFPKLSEIHNHLKFQVANKNNPPELINYYQKILDKIESLLTAKHELEAKYPDMKNVKYASMKMLDGSISYQGGIDFDDKIDE